jgi:ATP-dependent Clp protease ATP-binding subunit ClpA
MDAGNMLKPMLARGELHMIGATVDEYRKHIESDAALERRFQAMAVRLVHERRQSSGRSHLASAGVPSAS